MKLKDEHSLAAREYANLMPSAPVSEWPRLRTRAAIRVACSKNPGLCDDPAPWFRVSLPCVSIFGLNIRENADRLLRQIGDANDLELFIDSEGGNASTALQICDALRGRVKEVSVRRAFSAALPIAMLGREIGIERGGLMMVHAPKQFCFDDRDGLLSAVDELSTIAERLVEIISNRSGTKAKLVRKWFRGGSDRYFTAEQCVAFGLADEIIDDPPVLASRALPANADTIAPVDDGKAELLWDVLRAIGQINTSDRTRLMQNLHDWATLNVRQSL